MSKDKKIIPSSKYGQESSPDSIKHSLTVYTCSLEDAGEYTFNIRNKKHTVNLIVKGILKLEQFNNKEYKFIKL